MFTVDILHLNVMLYECSLCLTGHRDGQQLQDPEVEPHLNQHDGPDQQNEVDVAGFPTAFLFKLEAGFEGAREARGGGQGTH